MSIIRRRHERELRNPASYQGRGHHDDKESWYLSKANAAEAGFAISNFISQRIVRDQGGRPALEQFVQKKLRPVSESMKLDKS
jgi:hypothetical protein